MYRLLFFPVLATLFAIAITSIFQRPTGIEKHQGIAWCNGSELPPIDSIKKMNATWLAVDGSMGLRNAGEVVKAAHDRGLSILLFKSDRWDARHDTSNLDAKLEIDSSLQNYEQSIMKLAVWAQEQNIEALSLGNSISGINSDTRTWKSIIKKIRIAYRGTLVYFADPVEELQRIEFWDKLDFIGVALPLSSPVQKRNVGPITWPQVKEGIAKEITKFQKPVLLFDTPRKGSKPEESVSYDFFFKEIWTSNWVAGAYFRVSYVHQTEKGKNFLTPVQKLTLTKNFAMHEKRH